MCAMPDSNMAPAVCESRQAEFSHGLLTFAWPSAIPDFKRLSYAKDTCESRALSPRTGHANYRICPRQHGWAVSRLPERSAQGSGSGPDLSRDGKRGEGRAEGAGARAEVHDGRRHIARDPA